MCRRKDVIKGVCVRMLACICVCVPVCELFFFLVVGGYQLGALTINGRFVWYSTEVKAHNTV